LSIGLRIELIAQQPFILPTEGLCQYAYLEVNATTYARLSSNTFYVRGLAARWWTGSEQIYYADPNGLCDPLIYNTSDYASINHVNWGAGTIAYVSVQFKDCASNWQGNYNERSFQLIDVDNAYGGTFDDVITDNPTALKTWLVHSSSIPVAVC